MGLTLLCVGKARERYFADAVAEYMKRLSTLMPCIVVEVADEPEPKQLTEAAMDRVMRVEGEKLLSKVPVNAYVVALCVEAKQCTSEELAARIQTLFNTGRSDLVFIIGGSLGLHETVLARADERLGLSRMTLPHQLARVLLSEQLYRAAKINAGQRYHK